MLNMRPNVDRLFISYGNGKHKLGRDLVSVLTGEKLSNEQHEPIEYYVVLNKGNARLIPLNILIFAENDHEALTMMQAQGKRERCKVTLFNRKSLYNLVQFSATCKSFNSADAETNTILNGHKRSFDEFVMMKLMLVADEHQAEAIEIAKQFGYAGHLTSHQINKPPFDCVADNFRLIQYYENL